MIILTLLSVGFKLIYTSLYIRQTTSGVSNGKISWFSDFVSLQTIPHICCVFSLPFCKIPLHQL